MRPQKTHDDGAIRCAYCDRIKVAASEGRIADGSWAADADLPESYKGKWFCCFNCYDEVLREAEKNGE